MEAIEVGTNMLNYADVKKKALASKSLKSITAPSNGQTFNMGSTINFSTLSNAAAQYLDCSMSYLRFRINNNNASDLTLDQTAYSLFNRLLINTAGQTFQDTQNYNLLHNILYSLTAGQDYANNVGRVLMGAHQDNTDNSTYEGAVVPAGSSIVVSLPLVLSPLVNTQPFRYIPLFGRSSFDFKITLESAQVAFVGGATPPANSDVTITDFEFHQELIQLNEMAQQQVSSMTQGVYNILASEYINFQTTVQNGVNFNSFPLGLARSSLDRVLVCHRPQATVTNHEAFSLSNRAKADMQHIRLVVNGQSIPSRRIEVGSNGGSSNALAEYLISNHNLDDYSNLSNLFYDGTTDNFSLDNGNGSTASTIGSFIVGINCDSLSHQSDRSFSGINCIGATTFIETGYSSVPADMVLDVFAQSTILMSMDENSSGVFSVSV